MSPFFICKFWNYNLCAKQQKNIRKNIVKNIKRNRKYTKKNIVRDECKAKAEVLIISQENETIEIGDQIGVYLILDQTENVFVVRNMNTKKTETTSKELIYAISHNITMKFSTEEETLENLSFQENDRLDKEEFFNSKNKKKREKENGDLFDDYMYPR